MNNDELLAFSQDRLYKKLIGMQKMEQTAYMIDHFGTRWREVYDRLANTYPQLLDAPNHDRLDT